MLDEADHGLLGDELGVDSETAEGAFPGGTGFGGSPASTLRLDPSGNVVDRGDHIADADESGEVGDVSTGGVGDRELLDGGADVGSVGEGF